MDHSVFEKDQIHLRLGFIVLGHFFFKHFAEVRKGFHTDIRLVKASVYCDEARVHLGVIAG
jgi:hypothetical protein